MERSFPSLLTADPAVSVGPAQLMEAAGSVFRRAVARRRCD